MDKQIEKDIEEFYTLMEKGLDKYTRPVDYKERYLRVLNGKRNTYRTNLTGHNYDD